MPARGRFQLAYWAPRVFFVLAVLAQLYFIRRGYSDPHKHFAFQPFNESDTVQADISRVTVDGRRIPVTEPWFGYRWRTLVRERGLGHVHQMMHAGSGARSAIASLQVAIDWVADHTPLDHETHYYHARVTYYHNTRGPFIVELESKRRTAVALAEAGR